MEPVIWIVLAIVVIASLGGIISILGIKDPDGQDPLATDSSWLGRGCGCLVLIIIVGFLAVYFMAG